MQIRVGLVRFASIRLGSLLFAPTALAKRLLPSKPSMATIEAMRLSLSLAVAELGMRSLAAKVRVWRTVRALWCTLSCESGDGDSELRATQAGGNRWW